MANGWTSERKAWQSKMMQVWRPWEKATGPKTPQGKAVVSRNAFKGGEREMLRELARLLRENDEVMFR